MSAAEARTARRFFGFVFLVVVAASCAVGPSFGRAGPATRWQPTPGTSWQWQLSGRPGAILDVDAYDVDGFDTSKGTVGRIHAKGAKAICYISVGSWENWRPDRNLFPRRVLGNAYAGWPGERWLDIRQMGVLAPIMSARMDTCKRKGFDAVEPDNMDGYANKTGFPITASQQLRYNRWLARAAHDRGLAIAMKNDGGQVGGLVGYYDFAITEDCFDQKWCGRMSPFVNRNKAVLAVEYTDTGETTAKFCPQARGLGFDAILKRRDLGAWRRACR